MTATVTKEPGARTGGSGSQVLRVTGSSPYSGLFIYAQHSIILEAGTEYQIKGWLRCDPDNSFSPYVWTSPTVGGVDVAIVSPGGTTDWYEFDEVFTPATDSYLRFGGTEDDTPIADYWFEFDDITLFATADIPANPLLYWTAGGDAGLAKDLSEVFEGLRSLSVTADPDDFSQQDVNLDERYATVQDAFVMFDSGNGILQSRRLDPEPPS